MSEYVREWVSGTEPSDCTVVAALPDARGTIPTVVVAAAGASCEQGRGYKGVVFYGYEPIAWHCLSDAEVTSFKQWAVDSFPSVQLVTIAEPTLYINCPPTKAMPPDAVASLREQMRTELRALAPTWFVAPTRPQPIKQVA